MQEGKLVVHKILGTENPADLMTKILKWNEVMCRLGRMGIAACSRASLLTPSMQSFQCVLTCTLAAITSIACVSIACCEAMSTSPRSSGAADQKPADGGESVADRAIGAIGEALAANDVARDEAARQKWTGEGSAFECADSVSDAGSFNHVLSLIHI